MRSDTLARDAQRLGHAADYDTYARAEHMLRCYGAGYVCQHPELLFGRLPAPRAVRTHELLHTSW